VKRRVAEENKEGLLHDGVGFLYRRTYIAVTHGDCCDRSVVPVTPSLSICRVILSALIPLSI